MHPVSHACCLPVDVVGAWSMLVRSGGVLAQMWVIRRQIGAVMDDGFIGAYIGNRYLPR